MEEHKNNRTHTGSNQHLRSSGEGVRRSRLNSAPTQKDRTSDQGENLWARSQREAAQRRREQEAAARDRAEAQKKKESWSASATGLHSSLPTSSQPARSSSSASSWPQQPPSTARRSNQRSSSRATSSSGRSAQSTSPRSTQRARVSASDQPETASSRAATPRSAVDARPTYSQSPRARAESSRKAQRSSRAAEDVTSQTHFRQVISSVEPDHLSPTEIPFQAVADQSGVPIASVARGSSPHRSWSSHEVGGAQQARIPRAAVAVVLVIALAVVIGLVLKNTVFANAAEDSAADATTQQTLPVTSADSPNTNVSSGKDAAGAAASPVSITLSFAGDCTLGTDESFDQDTSFNAAFQSKDDPSWFFANVASIFAADDLTVANMEGTLTTQKQRADKTFAFKGDADFAQVLAKGNVDAASLANNHSKDYGDQSYQDTIQNVEAAGIPTFGFDRIAYLTVKDVKVALIGTYVLDQGTDVIPSMEQNIRAAQEEGAQIIAVYPHWGNELDETPDSTQVQVAHAAIDAGATVVVGSHPHVIQGLEKYQGRYIVYSLGNFCFGGNTNPTDPDCMIFQQTFQVTGTTVAQDDQVTTIPCRVSSSTSINNYQPTPAKGSEKKRIQAKIDQRTNAIGDSVSKAKAEASSAQAQS